MPNHVTNILKFQGDEERIKKLLEDIKDDECGIGSIDFNKLIPMPNSLHIICGSVTDTGLKAYRDFVSVYTLEGGITGLDLLNIPKESEEVFRRHRPEITAEEWDNGRTAFQNTIQYGHPTWYEWSISNWGTKWNAYGYDSETDYRKGDDLRFQTAWCAPHPVLRKLSEMYPDISFEHQWADEDLGVNCGTRTYLGGEVIDEYFPEGVRAMQFALDVWDYDPAELGIALNKTGTGYVSMTEDNYQLIELLGEPALFTNERLTDADIPEDLYCYHLRHSDDGERFAALEPKVLVNHGGSVIMDTSIDFGAQGYISLDEDTEPNFTGEAMTIEEFMNQRMITRRIYHYADIYNRALCRRDRRSVHHVPRSDQQRRGR